MVRHVGGCLSVWTAMSSVAHAIFAMYLTLCFWPFAALVRALYLPIYRRCCGRRCLWITTQPQPHAASSAAANTTNNSTSHDSSSSISSNEHGSVRAHPWPIARLPTIPANVIRIVCVSDTHGFQYDTRVHVTTLCHHGSIALMWWCRMCPLNSRLVDVPHGDILIHSGMVVIINETLLHVIMLLVPRRWYAASE